MGIFKESLNPFLVKQLNMRQELIAMHKDRRGVKGPSHVWVGDDQTGKLEPIFQPGAWHSYTTNKYCSIRMASCVDITTSELLELDLEIQGIKLEQEYKGPGLARNYMLQGGQLLNPQGAKQPAMRRGFPGGGRPLGGVYGDPLARANAKDGYGLVPMPGITKVNVRTKSAYGSLREAKIDFVCHNLRQLAVLELLYMRPGYPAIVEWGWSPYIDNEKIIQTDFGYISDHGEFWGQYSSGNTTRAMDQIEIAELINDRKKLYNGNYDAILGICKNFSYAVRPDGGFNCTTELMALGEIISSMKGKTMEYSYNSSITDAGNNTKTVTKKQTIPHLLDFLQRTHDFVANVNTPYKEHATGKHSYDGPDDLLQTEDDEVADGKHANRSAAYMEPVIRSGNMWLTVWDDGLHTYNITRAELEKDYRSTYCSHGSMSTGNDFHEKVHLMHFKEGRTNWDMFLTFGAGAYVTSIAGIYVGTLVAEYVKNYQNNQKGCTEGYIRLDALCYNINRHCINPVPRDQSKRFTCYQTVNYDATRETDKYRMNTFSKYGENLVKMTSNLGYQINTEDFKTIDMSTDPYVALMPSQFPDQFLASSNTYSTQFQRPIMNSFGYSGRDFETGGNASGGVWSRCFPKSISTQEVAKHSIGHIMINLKFLLDVHDELYGEDGIDSEDYSIGKFMQKVMDGLNKVMAGNNKFSLVTSNENPSVTEIVDLNHKPKGNYKDIFTFNVLSNDSVVRNFSYNSAVPSAMAATIAIGAGDPDNAASVDAVTFAAMNRGIKNRIFQSSPKKPAAESTQEEKDEALLQLQGEFNDIRDIVLQLKEFQALTISGEWFATKNASNRERLANIKTSLSRLRDLVNRVSLKDDFGLPLPKQNPIASTPIPIKVDLEMDGISGIVIGQLFRVEESRLPLQYRSKRIIFVCVSEEQNIDENGTWTTKISGQMQLFPDDPRKSNAKIDVTKYHFDPIPYARRFHLAMAGTGTDDAALNSLFKELSKEQMKKVSACWDSSPHFNKDGNTSKSLLEWIDAEIIGEYETSYTRWHCDKGLTKYSTEGGNPKCMKQRPTHPSAQYQRKGCFVAGTKVTMADNSYKNIENIEIGDVVKTWNENTGKINTNKVTKLKQPIKDDIVVLNFGNIEIKNTFDHPYYVENKGWSSYNPKETMEKYDYFKNIRVQQLEIGDICYKYNQKTLEKSPLTNIKEEWGDTQTYIFTADKDNTFFANDILVHNK